MINIFEKCSKKKLLGFETHTKYNKNDLVHKK